MKDRATKGFSRVLLVNPETGSKLGGIRPHTGLGYLELYLSKKGIECRVFDMRLGHSYEEMVERAREMDADLIGFSLYSFGYKTSYALIERTKRDLPGAAIVAGGPHISSFLESALEGCPAIDYGVVMEGEETLADICAKVPPAQIKGLLYRDNGRVIATPPREFIGDLDKLGFPTYDSFELKRYNNELNLITTRGCPYRCTFCQVMTNMGRKVRARSAESVVDELEYWFKRGYRQFNYQDDNFTFYRDRVFAICDLIEKRGLKGLFLRCSNGIRCDRTDREMLKRMKSAGFRSLGFGIEGGNDHTLRMMRKGAKMEKMDEVVRIASELGYEIQLFFVWGGPGETRKDIEDRIAFARSHRILRAAFYHLIPYPCTEVCEQIRRHGRFLREPEDYMNDSDKFGDVVFETPEMTAGERVELIRYTHRVEKEILYTGSRRALSQKVPSPVAMLMARLFVTDILQNHLFTSQRLSSAVQKLRYLLYFGR